MSSGNTPRGLGILEAEANRLLENSMANQSWQTYKTAVRNFQNFRHKYDLLDTWPVPVEHLIGYISHLSLTGCSASTVNTYLAAISYFHKIKGLRDSSKLFIVSKLVEGLRRERRQQDIRSPITLPLLRRLLASLKFVCSSEYETIMFTSAFTLAFFGFLRVGEFTSTSKKGETLELCR